jgi:hypothetical protein
MLNEKKTILDEKNEIERKMNAIKKDWEKREREEKRWGYNVKGEGRSPRLGAETAKWHSAKSDSEREACERTENRLFLVFAKLPSGMHTTGYSRRGILQHWCDDEEWVEESSASFAVSGMEKYWLSSGAHSSLGASRFAD